LDEAGKALNRLAEGLSNELIKQGEVLGEEIEKGVNEIIREIEAK
jgi:polyhydroxyalkanoate synthesis regulator phasin